MHMVPQLPGFSADAEGVGTTWYFQPCSRLFDRIKIGDYSPCKCGVQAPSSVTGLGLGLDVSGGRYYIGVWQGPRIACMQHARMWCVARSADSMHAVCPHVVCGEVCG